VARQSRLTEIDTVTAHRDSLSVQELALTLPLREAAVGADHSVPGEVLVRRGQHLTDEPRRGRVDVAIRSDETFWDLTYSGDDPLGSHRLRGTIRIA
jgi:hypothetical protein